MSFLAGGRRLPKRGEWVKIDPLKKRGRVRKVEKKEKKGSHQMLRDVTKLLGMKRGEGEGGSLKERPREELGNGS